MYYLMSCNYILSYDNYHKYKSSQWVRFGLVTVVIAIVDYLDCASKSPICSLLVGHRPWHPVCNRSSFISCHLEHCQLESFNLGALCVRVFFLLSDIQCNFIIIAHNVLAVVCWSEEAAVVLPRPSQSVCGISAAGTGGRLWLFDGQPAVHEGRQMHICTAG